MLKQPQRIWLYKCADEGDLDSINFMGIVNEYGSLEAPKNMTKALQLYSLAAKREDSFAIQRFSFISTESK